MITKQDYYNFTGIDLDIELKKSKYDNRSQAVEIFLRRIHTWCVDYLATNYAYTLTDEDVTEFNRGVLHQVEHELKNGHNGVLATNAKTIWQRAGFMNITQEDSKRQHAYYRL